MSNRALVIAVAVAISLAMTGAWAAGVVGTGTAVSCTEAALDTALTGGGSVTFNCGAVPTTITITTNKSITVATTVDGGNLITLDGGNSIRLFTVTGGGLTVQNITLANGHDTVALAGGAAITMSAPVTITDSTLSGHQTSNAGCPAIVVSGTTLTVTRSTITGNVNSAPALGTAICANNTSTVTITNSTITGNTGGAFDTSGTATITNSTIASNDPTGAGNSGGITTFGGTIVLNNTIISGNSGTGQCALVVGGTITDGGGNLQFPDNTCGLTIPVGNPLLGALASNGGPTQTMALGAGSPAIDNAVSANCPPTDQRGTARTDGDGDGIVVCDIGAFEAPAVPFVPRAIPVLDSKLLLLLVGALALVGALMLRRLR